MQCDGTGTCPCNYPYTGPVCASCQCSEGETLVSGFPNCVCEGEYFQNSPFFITLLLGLSYNNCILTKIEKKNIVLQKDNKYCHTEINHKIYFK